MSTTTQSPSILSLNMRTAYQDAHNIYLSERNRDVPHRLAMQSECERINRTIQNYGDYWMAKGRKPQNTAYGFTWVRVALTEQESQQFEAWYSKGAGDLYDLLAAMLIEGDKVSISYSEKTDSIYATVMGSENSHRNAGKGFSSYAKTPEQALALAVWKYHRILEGNMDSAPSEERSDFG